MTESRRSTLQALAIASLLALLEIFRTTVAGLLSGTIITMHELGQRVIPTWITVVLLSPWCAFMARRFPLRAGRAARTLLAHLGGGAVFVALQMHLLVGYHMILTHGRLSSFWPDLLHRYAFYIAMELSVYAIIVLVLLLLESQREASERAVTAARLAQSLAAARLESLQAQMRPHFLFNTLNTLAVLARKGDGPAVDRAIGDLGELLRASLDSLARLEIPLGEELVFLERYVDLQRLRFPDRLEVEIQVEPGARDVWVPSLLVQPLVENALEHGLTTARGGKVRVSARHRDDSLEIEVTDNGQGFGDAPPPQGGIGLANTRERLSLLYGDRGTLTCADREGGGGSVTICIPWRPHGAGSPA